MVKHFLSLADLTADEIHELLDLADELKLKQKAGEAHRWLEGMTLAMIFEKPSLRTRVTFEAGMFQLGGHAIHLETRLGERESVPDVARNLDRWVNMIMARVFRHEDLIEMARYSSVPVINALSDHLHPCQILADVQTLREHRGKDLNGMKVAFIGDGNNVFHSWANFASRVPIDLTLVCPPGYEGDAALVARVRNEAQGKIEITHDIEGMRGADVVYTDVWTSMGQEEEDDLRCNVFLPYQVNDAMMQLAHRDALFMHCLPAKRGKEVTDTVMEAACSVVFDQAENRLHAQKAVMVWLLGRHPFPGKAT